MSLIDDALKRARDRSRKADAAAANADSAQAGKTPETDPWAYAPLPERRSPSRVAWIGAAAAGILIAGVIVYFTARRDRGTPGSAAASAPGLLSTPAPSPPTRSVSTKDSRPLATVEVAPPPHAPDFGGRKSAPPADPAKATSGPSSAVPAATPAPLPARAEPALRETRLASSSPRIAGGSASRTEVAAAPAHAAHPGPAAADGRSYVGSLTAPNGAKVELEGIVYSESSPVALVNGRVLPPGGFVEGLAVVSIEPNRIELKGDGIRVFLAFK